ncbi:MAG: hypothetical protein JKZ03_06885, partial [Flavobacteriaceae bacterium]|nr:hypothetical protein [Flavobacteriaceae bacterium]
MTFLFFNSNINCFGQNPAKNTQELDSLKYYHALANSPQKSTDLQKAYVFYLKLKEQNLRKKDTIKIIHNLWQISIIQNSLGFLYDSENSAIEAIKLLDQLKDNKTTLEARFGLYNKLGNVYSTLNDNETAIVYYNKGLEIAQLPYQVNLIQTNKAMLYIDQNKYQLAEKELLEVYKSRLKLNDSRKTTSTLDELGFVQSKLNKPQGFKNLLKALEIRLGTDNV